MKQLAKLLNKNSRSNGCMMRISPLAVWLSGLVEDERDKGKLELYRNIITCDYSLTHADPLAQDCTFLYSLAISFLLNNPKSENKGQKCFDFCLKVAKTDLCNY